MIPKIALIGQPNVGKSALFNRLAGARISIVDDGAGITRDLLYAEADCFGRKVTLIDTGGIEASAKRPFNDLVQRQSERAIQEADAAVFVVDGQAGPTQLDIDVARILHICGKPVILAVNKIDDRENETVIHQFHSLAFSEILAVSAAHGFHVAELMEAIAKLFPDASEVAATTNPIRVTIAGRPNVGKSTLLNRLIGFERSIVSPLAGTTRDSIDAAHTLNGQEYLFIDTAGIRRKVAEKETVDKFAAVRTQEAIKRSDVVLFVLDAREGLTAQEKRIAHEIETEGKSCILLFNKWDLVHGFKMETAIKAVQDDNPFLAHCPTLFLSATSGRNVDKIYPLVQEVNAERSRRITTGELNRFIEACQQKYHPPMLGGKRLRIYYMTQIQTAPPAFVLFVNRPSLMAEGYLQYLINQFRESYRFSGCPLNFRLRGKAAQIAAHLRAT